MNIHNDLTINGMPDIFTQFLYIHILDGASMQVGSIGTGPWTSGLRFGDSQIDVPWWILNGPIKLRTDHGGLNKKLRSR